MDKKQVFLKEFLTGTSKSQGQLARDTGYTKGHISRLVRGDRTVTRSFYIDFAIAYRDIYPDAVGELYQLVEERN